MSSEHRFYPSYPPFALYGQPPMHPCHLPVPPRRFKDNINGIKYAQMPLDLLQQPFESVYNVDLQQEGSGQQWITLQGDMEISPGDVRHEPPQVMLRLADKSLKFTSENQFLTRYPDSHAPKAKRTLCSLVPTLAKNAGYYRTTRPHVAENVNLVTQDLQVKSYPNGWWKPVLYRCLDKWGLSPSQLLPPVP